MNIRLRSLQEWNEQKHIYESTANKIEAEDYLKELGINTFQHAFQGFVHFDHTTMVPQVRYICHLTSDDIYTLYFSYLPPIALRTSCMEKQRVF